MNNQALVYIVNLAPTIVIPFSLSFQMVRKYKRQSTRGSHGEDSLQNALHAVRNGMNIAQASLQYGIPSRTIRRHHDRAVQRPGTLKLGPVETVLPRDIEQQLAREIQLMERRMYAITTIDVRRLAYELAERQHVSINLTTTHGWLGKIGLGGSYNVMEH